MKKLNITKEQFNKSRYFQKKYGRLEYVSESGKLFKTDKGKVLKFNEGRLADKLNSGELFEKQMPSLGKAIQKFIDNGKKGQAGSWALISDDNGNIKLYEHYGFWFGTIVDGRMKWADDDGYYVSGKYSEMILNALCDAGLIERSECQRAIEDAYASEEAFEKEYGESTRKLAKESADIEDEVWSKWERMSDEITSALNLEQVAKSIAKKYFPRRANEIANWINENIELICTNGYAEDWTDLNSCLWEFTEDNDIPISDLA